MDKNTSRVLQKIGRSIPGELLKRGIVIERPYKFVQDFWEKRANDKRYSAKKRDEIKKALEIPMVRATHLQAETKVDEKVSEEIGRLIAAKVEKAVRTGEIPKPKKNDPFFAFMAGHMRHMPRHDKLFDFKVTPKN